MWANHCSDPNLINLSSVVERYERSFEQFRQETERAIATCRREFNDIRKKFEKLRRIRRSLVFRYAEREASRMDLDTDGPTAPKRKRWGKKSTARRRPNILDWFKYQVKWGRGRRL